MSALLTSETGNTSKVVKYINECREMGLKVLPPDVNYSDLNFTPDGDAIRFGLGAIKNVGSTAVESIVNARNTKGRFTSLYQFCEEVDMQAINRRMIESLIRAGAMDSLGASSRSRLFAAVEGAMEAGARVWKDRLSGQVGLFGMDMDPSGANPTETALPNVPDWTASETLTGEKEMLGIYVTGHPLDPFRDKVPELTPYNSGNCEKLTRGTEIKVCGILTGIQRKRNKEGKLFGVMQLEDWYGSLEALVFNSQYEALQQYLVEDKAVMLRASVLPEENSSPRLNVQEIIPLEFARVNYPALIAIRVGLGNPDRAAALKELLKRKPGETDVRLRLEKPREFSVTLDTFVKIRPDKEFFKEVESICGKDSIEVLAG
jgi:DNA polymerase-3 subunit alpha